MFDLLSRGLLVTAVSVSVFACGVCRGQQDQPKPQQGGMGGISSGVSAAPVFDDQKRPITAGGFVDSGPMIC
jgi:enediyne biosynthesis protein E4